MKKDQEDAPTIVTVPVTLDVPKEGKELIDMVALLISHFKNGGNVFGLTKFLGEMKEAIGGVEKIKDEIKSQYKDELAAYTVHKVWSSLESTETIDIVAPEAVDTGATDESD